MSPSPGELLERIAAQVRGCRDCVLCEGRRNAVPGEGPVDAPVAFIGEGPGAEEDEQGRPFVGRSGQLLRRTIQEAGVAENAVFIGNVVKCRPPGNRDPEALEIATCSHYLHAQLAVIRPRLIVTLGRFSLNLLIDPSLQITKVRGQLIRKQGQYYLPTLHPAAVLRNQNSLPDFRRDIILALRFAFEQKQQEQPQT